jgi:mycothiol synthase
MVEVRTRRPVAPDDVRALRALADRAEHADGHPSLSDSVWQELSDPAAEESTLLLAQEEGRVVGALHLASPRSKSATAAVVVDPERREGGVASALIEAAAAEATTLGCEHLQLWAFGADERADSFATAAGFRRERELWQMRVSLPLGGRLTLPDGVRLRTFLAEEDDDAWLEVNNRAFAADPDQQGWTRAELEQRQREAWFDPAGFLLAVAGERIAGFCWTKVHPPSPPHEPEPLGEIYVIGVDPDHQGTGLGRALVLAGLESLHERGITTGMLFVDSTNTPATKLYETLGFTVVRRDRAYGKDLR